MVFFQYEKTFPLILNEYQLDNWATSVFHILKMNGIIITRGIQVVKGMVSNDRAQ